MAFLYKSVGSYTLNVNVDDLGYSKPVLIYTNEGIVAISHEPSGEKGSISVSSALVLNEQLEKISKLFEVFPKIVSVNAVNNFTTTIVSSGDITPLPTIVECKSNVAHVLANGSISSYGSLDTAKNTFTASSTGNTIGEALNSARIALLDPEETFLLPDEKLGDGDIVSNSTNTFYATVSYNNVVEPGEKWVLSETKLPTLTGFSPSIAIGDTSEQQYFSTGTEIYKLIDNEWKEIFSYTGSFNAICTSADGQYVTGTGFAPNQGGGTIYVSDDFGSTWNPKIYSMANAKSGIALTMSKDGRYQTTVVSAKEKELYYSVDHGETWELSLGNKDPDSPIVYITMNASGTVQYATSGTFYSSDLPNNGVWLSTDFGKTWKKILTNDKDKDRTFGIISTNGDGSVVTMAVFSSDNSYIYYSSDFGETWNEAISEFRAIRNICMSSSGEYQTASYSSETADGTIYSVDYGASWNKSDLYKVSGGSNTGFQVAMVGSADYQIALTTTVVDGALKGYQIYVSEILL